MQSREDTDPDPLIGAQFGDVRVTKFLAEGGMGRVYLGDQFFGGTSSRRVVIKILERSHGRSGEELRWRLWEREVPALVATTHPNLVRCYRSGEEKVHDKHYAYVVMEYIQGPTLEAYAEQHAHGMRHRYGCSGLSIREALRIVALVAAGIRALHGEEVVHRDLKPENVLMLMKEGDGSAIPVVIDLGLATGAGVPRAHQTTYDGPMGTGHTMAPEQMGGRQIDVRADVYALGVMLYFLLAGFYPGEDGEYVKGFTPESERPTQGWLMHGAYLASLAERRETPRWFTSVEGLLREGFASAGVTPTDREERFLGEIDEFLRQALAPHPDDRFASVEAFMGALPEVPEVLRLTPVPRAPRRGISSRSRLVLGAMLTLLGLMSGALGVGLLRKRTRLARTPAVATAPLSRDADASSHAPPVVETVAAPDADAGSTVHVDTSPQERVALVPERDAGRRRGRHRRHRSSEEEGEEVAQAPDPPCVPVRDPVSGMLSPCL